jgi:hypothetical protein
MDVLTEARIFLEGQRGRLEGEGCRSLCTFNFGDYRAEGREPFGVLYVFNEETLGAQCFSEIKVDAVFEIILIPLVGGIEVDLGHGDMQYTGSGESIRYCAKPDVSVRIVNPYPIETVSYLQIRIKTDAPVLVESEVNVFDISVPDKLVSVCDFLNKQNHVLIGRYGGRKEDTYRISNPDSGGFVFVIEGAFEVQNRLMERRDGLSLRNVELIAFEALSQDAMLLICEVTIVS